jgi:GntR family transcriptional regulator of arabinose operon
MFATPVPEYARIKKRLIAEIRSQRWVVGATIPSENQLMTRYKVSRTTVVRALQELVMEGYLYRQQGRGTFVAATAGREKQTMLPLFIHTETYRLSGTARQVLLRILSGIESGLGAAHPGVNIRQVPSEVVDDVTRRAIDELKPTVALVIESSFNPLLMQYLHERGCICWTINEPIADGNCIYSDEERSGYLATRYLLERGRRRLALLNGPVDRYWGFAARLRGYQAALAEAGVEMDKRLVREGAAAIDSEAGRAMMRDVIDSGAPADGVVGVSDAKAMGAMAAAQEAGLRIPDDLLFVSIDDTIADQAAPPLSSVALPFEELGRQAAARATETGERALRGEPIVPQRICLQPRLVERG